MTLADFYLVCFLVGFALSALSLLLGQMNVHVHLPHVGDVHLPHIHLGHGGNVGGVHGGAVHAGGVSAGHAAGAGHGSADIEMSPFNFATIAAFLAWFGGSGYLLTRYYTFWYVAGLVVSIMFGLAGAAVVFWALGKLVTREENLDPADYEMIGVLGRVVSPIRERGTGEIVFVQGGTRHTAGARSENGLAIAKEEEVVVTRYEKGIAYVRRWEELEQEGAEVKEEGSMGAGVDEL